jgi:Fe2+ or Zn2+ uptake regulation protein
MSSDYERMLRRAGLRVTRPRLAALSVAHDHPHADTDSIITAVRKKFAGYPRTPSAGRAVPSTSTARSATPPV